MKYIGMIKKQIYSHRQWPEPGLIVQNSLTYSLYSSNMFVEKVLPIDG